MSDYTVIWAIGKTLESLLKKSLENDFGDQVGIAFESPKEIKDDQNRKISIFLYQILENPHLKNEPLQRVDDIKLETPPLAIDLFYLFTVYGQNREDEMKLFGKVLQTFYDHSILTGSILQQPPLETGEEIKLLLNPLSLDDLTKLWNTFQDVPFKLSVSYMVTPVRIDSTRELDVRRVVSKEMGYYQAMPKKEEK